MEKTLITPRYIYGYENPKNLEILASLVCAIERGIELPPVQLVKVSETELQTLIAPLLYTMMTIDRNR